MPLVRVGGGGLVVGVCPPRRRAAGTYGCTALRLTAACCRTRLLTPQVGWDGVRHVDGGVAEQKDFSEIIKAALVRTGFGAV